MKISMRFAMALMVIVLRSASVHTEALTLVNNSSYPIYLSYTTICEVGAGVIGGLTKVTKGDSTDPIPLYPGKIHEINHTSCRIIDVKLFKGCLSSVKNGERLDGKNGKLIIYGESVAGKADVYDEVPVVKPADSSLPGALAELSPYLAKSKYYIHDRK